MLRISHGLLTTQVVRWSSEREARGASKWNVEIANEDSLGAGPVYEFTQVSELPEFRREVAVYIQMDSEFGVPTVLGVEWAGGRWIGCNSQVYVVSPLLEVEKRVDLGSPFADFRTHSSMTRLLVVAETGLVAFSVDGTIAWKVDLDVITDLRWRDGFAAVAQMDGPEVLVDLEDGEVRNV